MDTCSSVVEKLLQRHAFKICGTKHAVLRCGTKHLHAFKFSVAIACITFVITSFYKLMYRKLEKEIPPKLLLFHLRCY